MHQVLQNLLARRNQPMPAGEGRKITLILFGGIMVSARGAAALAAFEEMGLTSAFDEIYTMSSGFANCSYFLACQMKQGVSAYYQEMSGLKFLNFFKLWGLANLDHLENVVKTIKPLNLEKLYANRTKLYTMVTKVPDLKQGVFLELHDFDQRNYFKLLRACSSLPVVAGGSVEIDGSNYRDIFYDGALEDFVNRAFSGQPTDVIMIYNYDWQRLYLHQKLKNLGQSKIFEFCPKFFAGRKEWLQKITRFETRSQVLKNQCQIFGNEVKQALGSQEPLVLL